MVIQTSRWLYAHAAIDKTRAVLHVFIRSTHLFYAHIGVCLCTCVCMHLCECVRVCVSMCVCVWGGGVRVCGGVCKQLSECNLVRE